MYLIFFDNDGICKSYIRSGRQDDIDRYAIKHPDYTPVFVDHLPVGFECGPIAKTTWHYDTETGTISEIIPTAAELLETAKTEKKNEIKATAKNYILSRYPAFRQRNALIDGNATELGEMRTFIQAARKKSDDAEAAVDALTDIKSVRNYKLTNDDNILG